MNRRKFLYSVCSMATAIACHNKHINEYLFDIGGNFCSRHSLPNDFFCQRTLAFAIKELEERVSQISAMNRLFKCFDPRIVTEGNVVKLSQTRTDLSCVNGSPPQTIKWRGSPFILS